MQLPFTKMHGAGNDFVVLDALRNPLPEDFEFSRAAQILCERNRGVGGDGLLLLDRATSQAQKLGAAGRMRMWNPDGSEDMCGNGLRCIAFLAAHNGHEKANDFIIETLAGLRQCKVLCVGPTDAQIAVDMGRPHFDFASIPMRALAEREAAIEYQLPVGDIILPHVSTLSTGSTHTIIFSDHKVSDEVFSRLSPLIEHHDWFPERTSIMWAQRLNEHELRLRIWERGVGETLACGTGACASAVAAIRSGRAHGEVQVHSRGGILQIAWEPGGVISMSGPAVVVFKGEIEV